MKNSKLLEEFLGHTYSDWVNEAELSLKGKPIAKLQSKTFDDIDILPIYFPESLNNIDFLSCQYPGFYPYLRNSFPTGYKINKWKIAQDILVSNPEEFNSSIVENIKREQNCILLNYYPNQNNDYLFHSIDCINKALRGIDISDKYIIFRLGFYPFVSLSLFFAFLEKNQFDKSILNGSLEYDPLDLILGKGSLPYSIDYSLEQLNNTIKIAFAKLPNFKSLVIDSKSLSHGGANAILEIAYLLTKGIYYLNKLSESGFAIEDIMQKIKFNIYSSPNFFVEIAKIRAFRLLWSKVVKEYISLDKITPPFIHYSTNIYNKTKLDIENNILRNTTETLSGVLSGCDIITTHSLGFPFFENDFTRRIAINTQLILKYECNFTEVIDPAGGAYFIENLTKELAEKSWELVQKIESGGGILETINKGFLQEQVSIVATKRQENLFYRKDILIGVNKYPNPNEKFGNERDKLEPDQQITYRETNTQFLNLSNELNTNFESGFEQLIELALQNVQIQDLERIAYTFNNKSEVTHIPALQLSKKFEELRLISKEYIKHKGESPKCFFANLGTISQYKLRADFANDYLRIAGIEPLYTNGFDKIEDVVKAFLESNTNLLVICSSDDLYSEMAPQIARLIKKAKPLTYIILAGNPGEKIDEYKNSGIDDFIHLKTNILDSLINIMTIINGNKS